MAWQIRVEQVSLSNCKKCHRDSMFVDRAVGGTTEGEPFVDLYCLVCGHREFVSVHTPLGMSLMTVNNG